METSVQSQVAAEIVASDSPRKAGFNYGIGWGQDEPLPAVYFDAVRLNATLRSLAHEATRKHWDMETAVRNVRLAETVSEKEMAVAALTLAVNSYADNTDVQISMLVDDMVNTVNQIAPKNPVGYTPHMGLHYAVKPLRTIVQRMKDYLASVGG